MQMCTHTLRITKCKTQHILYDVLVPGTCSFGKHLCMAETNMAQTQKAHRHPDRLLSASACELF